MPEEFLDACGDPAVSICVLYRHRRRLYIGLADGSISALPTAGLMRAYRHSGTHSDRRG